MKLVSRLVPGGRPEDRAVRRVVAAVSISAFAEWGGSSAVLPLLPVYLRRHGSSVTMVGFTMAAFFAAAVAVQYPLGRLSDRIGRRTIQVGGLVTYSLATLLFIFFSAPVATLALRALQGAGVGIVDVANSATIGEVVPESQRGRAYGALYGTRTVGMAVAPFLGGLFGLHAMSWLFLAAAIAVLLAALPILLFTPRFSQREPLRRHERTLLWRNRSVMGVGVAFLAGGIVVGMYEVCWSLLLTMRGARSWEIGLSWTLFAIPFAVISVPAGWLVDHMDRRVLTLVALAGTAAFASTYPFVGSVAWLVGLGAGEAVTVALGGPAQSAQLSRSVDGRELGRAQGAVSTAQTGAMAVSASIAGALFGLRAWLPFVLAGALIVCCIGVIGLLWRGVPGRGSAVPARAGHPAAELVPVSSPEPSLEQAG
ncbi:MAG TPA: MFS transporter [Acidimicrobiales bacterium]|nr:MFS transporter [Acidimicrobiales bacterium]